MHARATTRYNGGAMRKRTSNSKRMATKKASRGVGPLELALAHLIENQAALLAEHRIHEREMAEINRRIEARWIETKDLFRQIFDLLERLPEAIRREIGFTSKS